MKCKHDKLHFSTGALHIQCEECNSQWEAKKSTPNTPPAQWPPDYDRIGDPVGHNDYRTSQPIDMTTMAKLQEARKEITYLTECLYTKNKELDSMYYVWCDGGCEGGTLRYKHPNTLLPVTEDLVKRAEYNVKRLRKWYNIWIYHNPPTKFHILLKKIKAIWWNLKWRFK